MNDTIIQINNSEFISEAENIYRKNPAQFGFAFWKYRELIKEAEVHKAVFNGYTHLYAIKDNKLIFYWSDDIVNMLIPSDRLANFDLLFVPARYASIADSLKNSHNIYDSNALIYNESFIQVNNINQDYYTDSFDFHSQRDYEYAANIINNSTPYNGNMTPERIRGFTGLPVFDKDLWVFVKEAETHIPVSIGICIHDSIIKETELEWIYVHKEHQRKRIGSMLINEIITRSARKSATIRVGGVADDFYMRCGFGIKTEPWLWIPKKDTKVGWWD